MNVSEPALPTMVVVPGHSVQSWRKAMAATGGVMTMSMGAPRAPRRSHCPPEQKKRPRAAVVVIVNCTPWRVKLRDAARRVRGPE